MKYTIIATLFLALLASGNAQETKATSVQESENKRQLLKGWNTWNNPSVLSHVKMPEGLGIQLMLRKQRRGPYWLKDSYISSPKYSFKEKILPGKHAYDGSYTALELNWEGQRAKVETASDGDAFVMRYTPLESPELPHILVLETGILWNKPGILVKETNAIKAQFERETFTVSTSRAPLNFQLPLKSPYFSFYSDKPVLIYAGKERFNKEKAESLLQEQQSKFEQSLAKYGDLEEVYEAMQSVMAWNLFYDAQNDRGIASVSRIWNEAWGGYIIFDWDTYFAALMASVDHKQLAYANAMAITNAVTEKGFVPNLEASHGLKSFDRSQPPVGSFVCKTLYDRYGERWFLEAVFQNLLRWNRWWDVERNNQGFLSWGSDAHPKGMDQNTLKAAKYESGLDNSPLFDQAVFDSEKEMMELASVGLMSLYIADCNYLAEIAAILGASTATKELKKRSKKYRKKLQELWDAENGIFRDKNLVTGEFSPHLAPTNFYPLLAKAATPLQAKRMVQEHLLDANEFYGEWMLPSIARSDPAFGDNSYWRGRIWAPMNFLVYMGLRNYNFPKEQRMLADKSKKLLLGEWSGKRRIHENYNSTTGQGDDVKNSDPFYSWGGLLGLISLIEEGYYIGF